MRTLTEENQYDRNDERECSIVKLFGKPAKEYDDLEPVLELNDSKVHCKMAIACEHKGSSSLCKDPLYSSLYIGLFFDHINIDGSYTFIDMLRPNTVHAFEETGVFTCDHGNCKPAPVDLVTFVNNRRR